MGTESEANHVKMGASIGAVPGEATGTMGTESKAEDVKVGVGLGLGAKPGTATPTPNVPPEKAKRLTVVDAKAVTFMPTINQQETAIISGAHIAPTLSRESVPTTMLERNPLVLPVSLTEPGAFPTGGSSGERERRENIDASVLQEHERTVQPLRRPGPRCDSQELVVANRVLEDDPVAIEEGLQRAQEVDASNADDHDKKLQDKKKEILTKVLVGGILFVALLVVILVFALADGPSDPVTTPNPTAAITLSPTLSPKAYVLSLLPPDLIADTNDPTHPLALAIEWILQEDWTTMKDSRIVQRLALVAFYFATNGNRWIKNESWLSQDTHECDWYAVNITAHRDPVTWSDPNGIFSYRGLANVTEFPCEQRPDGERVFTHLWLTTNGLEGAPLDFLHLLKSLKSIVLGKNEISGSLPSTLGLLTDLVWLDISPNAGLNGTIPTQLGLLTNVLELYLGTSQLSGTVPTELGLLTNLEYDLDLSENPLTGSLPSELGALSKVKILDFRRCGTLTGTIPTEFGGLEKVQELTIHRNSLTGKLPTELGLLTDMTWLLIPGNTLTGTIPSELAMATSITHLYLYEAALTGNVPSELAAMPNMVWFLFDRNFLTGSIPTEVGLLGDTEDVDFQHNLMTGTVPSEVGLLSNAKWLSLGDNHLSG
ncbi:LRR receptor-like serine threonine-protein kinase [Seminavis robusta]|uniref:LRR receptor-like serine threonine-protein kinase n=1 Tax=Seminavis robusta TaxID=568900 RepID=A0A9N8HSG6_9STRA|nr:LRR receptor-like serine threonine-protein kinase [Seminavis robusta]|eukprot:Sro1383_g268020.1 LRR receptor-like serine threonine-protein kinase (657) ;mRNA; r:21544-23514